MSRSTPQIDPVRFRQLYAKMQAAIASLVNKEGLLVFGKTGSGKSTTIAYLLNRVIKKALGSTVLNPKYEAQDETGKPSPKIGNTMESQTLYPSSYDLSDVLSLIDTAGLGDTRGIEISLLVALAIKQISEIARTKGVMMVLPVTHFTKDRGTQLVDAFELISQMTQEFKPETFVFSVTGLPENMPSAEIDSTKTELLNQLTAAKTVIDERVLATTDVAKKSQLRLIASALQTCVTRDNLFLITDLEDRAKQAVTIDAFKAYVGTMPGLKDPLSLPLTRDLELELTNWSSDIAVPALSLLSDRKTAHQECTDAEQKQKDTARLHAELHDALSRLPAVDALETLETDIARLRAKLASLTRQQNETVALELAFPRMRLPKPGAGVGSVMRGEVTINGYPSFAPLEENVGTRIISSDLAAGTFTAEVQHVVTGRETDAFITGGVKVHVLKRNMPDFRDEMDTVNSELDALERAATMLEKERKTYEAKILKLQTEIRGKAGDLGLTLRAEDTPREMVAQLAARRDEWNAQLVTLQARKTDFDTKFNTEKENYQFLFEVAGHTDLDKKNPKVAEFMPSYAEAAGMRYAAPMTSPTRAQMSMFGSTTAAANTHFAATHHDAQQQHRDPAATLVAGH